MLGGLTAACSRPHFVRVGIAAQQSISQVPVYLAAQDARTIELTDFPGASKGMEALLGGSIDVLSGYYTQALQVRAQERAIDVFFPIYDSLLIALAVSPAARDRIQTPRDLKGVRIGVTTLGSATHQFADFLLRRAGLQPAEATPVAIGTAARAVAAIDRGIVDAGVVTDFTIRYLEKKHGPLRLLADTRTRDGVQTTHGASAFPGTVLMASRQWLDANREQAKELANAVGQAMQWMRQHTPDELTARMPPEHYGGDREAYLAANAGALPLLARAATIDEAAHRSAVEFLALPATTPSAFREVS